MKKIVTYTDFDGTERRWERSFTTNVHKTPEPNYIFDPSYVIRPDGSLYIREVSIIPNPEKGE